MRLIDLISLIFENLGRRKGRVLLTAIGVVIGTAAVVVLVSLAVGLQRSYTSQFGSVGDLTLINVSPNYMMMEEMAVKASGPGNGGPLGPGDTPQMKMLTEEALADIRALPGVKAVIPRDYMQAGGLIKYGRLEMYPSIMGMGTDDLSLLDYPLKSGTLKLERGTVIVGEELLKQFYDPRQRPGQAAPEIPDLQDKQLRITLMKWTSDGTEVRKTLTVKVAGIIATTRRDPDWWMFMPMEDVTGINEWVQGRRINRNKDGYNDVLVKADSTETVVDITDQISAMGFMASAPQSMVESVNSFFTVLQVIFGGVGAVALLVAAIGIANTMTMAILERTREIGVMKAVGATNNNVLSVFLGEAAGIGFLGGVGGVLIGWATGQIIHYVAMAYLANQASQGGMPSTVSVYTPVWLLPFAVLFATIVGLLSGLYPALRAATLVPVTALKYE